eukprot:SAG11_NODE_3120_length_2672_cov_1.911776_2_plen_223_part_00
MLRWCSRRRRELTRYRALPQCSRRRTYQSRTSLLTCTTRSAASPCAAPSSRSPTAGAAAARSLPVSSPPSSRSRPPASRRCVSRFSACLRSGAAAPRSPPLSLSLSRSLAPLCRVHIKRRCTRRCTRRTPRAQEAEAQRHFGELCRYLGEEPDARPAAVFAMLREFNAMLVHFQQENTLAARQVRATACALTKKSGERGVGDRPLHCTARAVRAGVAHNVSG